MSSRDLGFLKRYDGELTELAHKYKVPAGLAGAISYYAYEVSHSGGEEEVFLKAQGLLNDLGPEILKLVTRLESSERDNIRYRTMCNAAHEEIQGEWEHHGDSSGRGPDNLMGRLCGKLPPELYTPRAARPKKN